MLDWICIFSDDLIFLVPILRMMLTCLLSSCQASCHSCSPSGAQLEVKSIRRNCPSEPKPCSTPQFTSGVCNNSSIHLKKPCSSPNYCWAPHLTRCKSFNRRPRPTGLHSVPGNITDTYAEPVAAWALVRNTNMRYTVAVKPFLRSI